MSTPTAREFAFATETDLGGAGKYRAFCRATGLDPVPGGYGMLMVDGPSGPQTFVTDDVEYVRALRAASKAPGLLGGMEIPPGKFPLVRDGWPDDWA
ncbi:hypothetical protein [Streptomyces platensis]|uniref:hypothetical protein n=1 Tax=Streptomyces platensis TaxID=58346 RepID=UPI003317C4F6